ncbi:MAG: hypothetical protein HN757_10385 [Calditrichaeota bacterium]|nr:hypothetical protein [Calditrichota bacterium]
MTDSTDLTEAVNVQHENGLNYAPLIPTHKPGEEFGRLFQRFRLLMTLHLNPPGGG